ncbi:hypothetical protein JTE90_024346 [Oedothorax gibbosus]|uniref:SAGA-associated factor 11 n=1 Tax=Oedothorax gibbosus TaxID=931172 RepID=A0AAV6VZC1_9ARAC|nr:hypothetical protein JTE90_024346 [Oedothorax gibbosus]
MDDNEDMDPCTSGSVLSDSVPDTPASYENEPRNTDMEFCTSGSVPSDSVPDTPASYENEPRNTEACQELFHEMVEDLVLKTCFEMHRALKLGYLEIEEYIVQDGNYMLCDVPSTSTNDPKHHELAASSKKTVHTNCPHCKRKLGTNRFTPHLHSCMGEGGRLNRNARRNCKTYESDEDDDEDSEKKKKKKGKLQLKTNKTFVKGKNAECLLSALQDFQQSSLVFDEKKNE